MAIVVVALAGSCTSTHKHHGSTSDPNEWADRAEVDGDFDKAEQRWRREIAEHPWSEDDMNIVTADPPPGPVASGAVAVGDKAEGERIASADEDEQDGFWGRFGKASFSAFTVLFTVGMAVAPYLLL